MFRAAETPAAAAPPPAVPLWLLDVDGVLNVVPGHAGASARASPGTRRGSAVADGVRWPIRYVPAVTAAVARLHTAGAVECRWLTTWGEAANAELRRVLGLPHLDVVATPHVARPVRAGGGVAFHGAGAAPDDGEWWKLAAVRALVAAAPGRPLVWTDDDLRHHPEAVAWVRRHGPPSLLVAPRPHEGLTRGALSDIEEFCALHGRGV